MTNDDSRTTPDKDDKNRQGQPTPPRNPNEVPKPGSPQRGKDKPGYDPDRDAAKASGKI